MTIRLLWDMDGTLVDSEKVWTVSLQDTARALGGELSAAARTPSSGRTCRAPWGPVRRPRPAPRPGAAGRGRAAADRTDRRAVRRRAGVAAGRPGGAAHGAGRGLAHRAGHQHRPGADRAGARRDRPGALPRHRVRRRGAPRQARSRPVPAGRGAARGARRGSAWPSRTPRRARWPPSGPAPAVLVVPCEVPVPRRSRPDAAGVAGRADRGDLGRLRAGPGRRAA